MNPKHRRTLEAIFNDSVRSKIRLRDIERMLQAARRMYDPSRGGAVRIAFNSVRAVYFTGHTRVSKPTSGRFALCSGS